VVPQSRRGPGDRKGIILWLINRFIPMASSIKTILNVVVVIAVIWWLLSILGVVAPLRNYQVG
jgi:hypothetical protein